MKYFIVNDLPSAFGHPYIMAAFADKKLAELNLHVIRGYLSGDSYTHQYVVLENERGVKRMGLEIHV